MRLTLKFWMLVIGVVPLVWGVDQLTKYWAIQNLSNLEFYGPFGFVLHRNPGAILGAFSNLPPILRVVSLSTGGAFLVFIYGALQYVLRSRALTLRLGMSILLGGILGNVTDRIVAGSVVDFLLIGSSDLKTPAFNFADVIQWVGYGMIVLALLRDGHEIWPQSNIRKQVWILPNFQLKYCLLLVFIGLGFSIIAGVFSYTFLMVTIEDLAGASASQLEGQFLGPFLLTYSLISLGFLVVLFAFGRVLSHRTAGPLYAFELFLEDVLNGKDRSLKIRAGDEFRHLEELAEDVRKKLKNNFVNSSQNVVPFTSGANDGSKFDSTSEDKAMATGETDTN